MRFRAGNKVKYKDEEIETCNAQKIFIVKKVSLYHNDCLVCDINDPSKTYIIDGDYLELADNNVKYKKPTKDELFNMPKGTKIYTNAKKYNEYLYNGYAFDSYKSVLFKNNISDELTIDNGNIYITRIEMPIGYETVYKNDDFITDLTKDIKYYHEENDWLRKKNKALEVIVAELQEKLKQANIDVDISKQEMDIMDVFFNEED